MFWNRKLEEKKMKAKEWEKQILVDLRKKMVKKEKKDQRIEEVGFEEHVPKEY